MTYRVRVTDDAKRDLWDIADYLLEVRGPGPTEHVIRKLEDVVNSLAEYPERGPHPPELLAVGERGFRQAYFKPYRLIYKIAGGDVFIYLIADGRRDMQTLLARRLLAPE
jgi:toxin ParE1/3/4